MKFGTKAIHAGIEPDPTTGAIMTPIYQTSTYVQKAPGQHKGYEYARTQNPTRDVLQKALAELEGARYGICFSSGLAAEDAIVKLFNPGDEIISASDLYGGSYRLFVNVFQKYGLKFHFAHMENIDETEHLINENTKAIWIETPTNPMLNIIDIEGVIKMAHKHNLITIVDNTFATPYLQQPMSMGADIVVHSATKYLGGHSDVVLGAALTNKQEIAEQLAYLQNACGGVPGPQDCFLVLRGIKTLHVRMQRHCENARLIAEHLLTHDKVRRVNYPGFENHPNHEVAKKQMRDFGGMVSFDLKNNSQEEAFKILTSTKLFALAESLGGVESLIGHPATMTHGAIPREEREKTGVTESLIRLSVGIEDADDLIADLDQALKAV